MQRYTHRLFRRLTHVALASPVLVAFAACENSAPNPSAAAAAEFKSFKPGSAGAGKLGAADSTAAGGAANTAGAQETAGTSKGVKVEEGDVAKLSGDTLYVLNQWRGLQVVDLADPAKPKLVGKAPMTGTPREMYVQGDDVVVVLAQVAELKDAAGKPTASAGSQVRRVQLGKALQETASLAIPGYAALTKRVGDKLVIIAPQMQWNPWWGGCWGPYGCAMLAGDAAGGSATKGGVASSGGTASTSAGGASMAYPGGYSGGWHADKTKIIVVDLAKAKALSIVGEVEIAGGVLNASIVADEVLIASSSWAWQGDAGTQTERLSQVKLDAAGKPTLGASSETKLPWSNNSSSALVAADKVAPGRMVLSRQSYSNTGAVSYQVEAWQVSAAQWAKTSSWAKNKASYGARLVIDGTTGVLATSEQGGATDGTSPGKDPDGSPPNQKILFDVLDLSDAATIAAVGKAQVPTGGYDVYSLQLKALQDGFWLVSHRGSNYSDAQVKVLDLLDPKNPKWAGKLALQSDYGMQVEVLAPGVLAMPLVGGAKGTTGGDPKGGESGVELPGVQLMSLGKDGSLTKRGLFQSDFVFWYQLKNLMTDKLLLRIASAGLETVDVANLDKPKQLGKLDLAAEVTDAIVAADRVVALVHSWHDNKAWLRVLPKGGSDEMAPEGQLEVTNGWGKLYANGSMIYLSDGNQVRVFDVSDPQAPKAKGSWTQPQGIGQDGENSWWNTYDMAQKGSTLFVTSTQVSYKKATGKDCGSSGVNGSTGESTPPSSGSGGGSSGSAGSADAGASDPSGQDGGTPTPSPDSPDAGSGKSGGSEYVPTCYINPVYLTQVVALDLSNPDAPKLGGKVELKNASWTQNAQVVGNSLVLTHYKSLEGKDGQWYGEYWLDRLDITNPNAPKLQDSTNVPGWLVGVAADGKSAVTVDWQVKVGSKPEDNKVENVLVAITLSGGKAKIVKSAVLPDQVGATLRHGDAIFVSTWPYWWNWPQADGSNTVMPESKLLVFDAKDPAKLAQTAAIDAGAGVSYLQVAGGNLFAGLGNGLGMTAWSLASATQPKFSTFLPTQGYWSPRVLVQDKTAFVPAGWYGITAYALAP